MNQMNKSLTEEELDEMIINSGFSPYQFESEEEWLSIRAGMFHFADLVWKESKKPIFLTYQEIIEAFKKSELVGIVEGLREIETAVLKKNGYAENTLQFDWDYLTSLLNDEDNKDIKESVMRRMGGQNE